MKYAALVLMCLCLGCGAISAQLKLRSVTVRAGSVPVTVEYKWAAHPIPWPGDTLQLRAKVFTSDGGELELSGAEVDWRSYDTKVATVDAQGKVTFLAEGEALIGPQCNICLGGASNRGVTMYLVKKPPYPRSWEIRATYRDVPSPRF